MRKLAALGTTFAALLALPTVAAPQPEIEFPPRRWTTIERLSSEHLAAAHRDVLRHRGLLEPMPPIADLVDYRAIFHAHAGDSSHTGGSLEEMLSDARRIGVDIVFLSDHYRPPRDFMDGWRGLRKGVLFVPGSEAHGYLLHPQSSVVGLMEGDLGPLLEAVSSGGGLAFLSHIEERPEHSLDGVVGMEIYNRHADSKDDGASLRAIVGWMTDPEELERLDRNLELYPQEIFAAQLDYPADYLRKWDRETRSRRVVGVAANDCHHNQVFVLKKIDDRSVRLGTAVDADDEMRVYTTRTRPRLLEMTEGAAPGAVLARLDFDRYWVAMRNTSTHVLAPTLDESAVRGAVAAGHVYVSHDWMADPTGFRFEIGDAIMGDEALLEAGSVLRAAFPLECMIRVLRDGVEVSRVHASHVEQPIETAGVYRVEGWLEVDREMRPWVYSNPIYVGAPQAAAVALPAEP